MSDPARMLQTSNDELERALLRAGSRYEASADLRDKTLAALGITTAAAAIGSGAVAAASGSKLGLGSLAKLGTAKLLVLGVAVGSALSLPLVLRSSSEAPPAAAAPVAAPAPAPAAPPAAVVADATNAKPPESRPAVEPEAPRAAPSARSLSSAEALRVELQQLDAARSKLKSGRSEEALALLDAYDRSAPRGMLKLEAEVLRIDALSRSGRSAQAQSRARAFLQRYPKSVLAARVRRLAALKE